MIGLPAAELAEAARAERDLRLERATAALKDPNARREEIVTSCQCWSAIAAWLETGRFESFLGGETSDGPVISWPELEAAALLALRSGGDACDRLFAAETVKAGEYEAACARRSALWAIHRAVSLRRESLDWLNAAFHERRNVAKAA